MSRFDAAVFLDRDGTLIDEVNYLARPDQVRLIPGAAASIAALNRARFAAVLVSNQAGVARGLFLEDAVHRVHARLSELLEAEGAGLDALFYCPHHPEAAVDRYRLLCRCRKPAPGMVEEARDRLELHGLPSYVIGDKALDIGLARAVGAMGILVRTGYGAREEQAWPSGERFPDRVVDHLPDAVRWILARHP